MSEDLPSIPSSSTLEDVARVAGVSRATVSRVINGIRNVDPDIQEKVRQAIVTTGYAPNRAARSLVTRRTGSIALVVSGAAAKARRIRSRTGSSATRSSAAWPAASSVSCAPSACTRS
ncbi:LacI family DNA-binding transcriptional regulator [Streptosporangium lutulentum]